MRWTYSVEQEQLRVAEAATGRVRWQGKPDRHAVAKVLPLSSSEDCIALLRWWPGPGRDFPNVLRCRPDGSVVWRAPVARPGHRDCYSDISWTGGGLHAFAISGFSVALDEATGAILSRSFAK